MQASRNGNVGVSREAIRGWLSKRCDHDSSQRLISRKRKIEELGEIEVSQSKRVKKIRFSDKVQQKDYNRFEQPSAVENNHNVIFIDLKN